MAGAVDMSFSSSANLELFKLDFPSDDHDLPFSGAIPSSEPFNRLSWGKSPSSGSEELSLGLIAGDLVDGNIGVWNPSFLMRQVAIIISLVLLGVRAWSRDRFCWIVVSFCPCPVRMQGLIFWKLLGVYYAVQLGRTSSVINSVVITALLTDWRTVSSNGTTVAYNDHTPQQHT
ncbi:hypothetical protein L1987_03782 [Smallanthus sonchifolius]|uniref:Uncharacterized protein n=1 Tax=Smallanthus sonchifolius TaxID=185202 RepID=A0ACB9KBU5_9ASTR|nr:hypothetical protein L1987_03782 [Smallanthus sonchifolius]